jgi:hypothetical protein
MALGTITKVTANGRSTDRVVGNKRVHTRDVQCTSGANYTTGGSAITAAAVGLKRIEEANIISEPTTASGSTHRVGSILYQADGSVKLVIGGAAAGAEVAAATDLSTFTARIEFTGTRAA